MSQVKKPVIQEMHSKTGKYQKNRLEFIKNPSVLEFLGLPGNAGYSEAILEKAIINHLQQFILELGKGFAFVERQQLIRTETSDYYIDMVFYNYIRNLSACSWKTVKNEYIDPDYTYTDPKIV
jgi:predicted nuclease of restriction endonuclease-like (RecB) superfamily